MIVEDHPWVRKALRQWLEQSFPQYQLLEAANGEEAVTIAQAASPCLVIMDIGLPGMTGIQATATIKKSVPSAKVVMLTVYDNDDSRDLAAVAGASAFISKSRIQPDLLPTLTRLLGDDTI